ncbi:arabinogalactan endo-1,4-beta-galactosidase [Paenibacillus phyllosphaerae]|uniref:Arabinogalactan endo-beta-1,4-galactanase n=1 Tax=Paenibacillus phyllosphaerae TaxID=274593 RepID=A0A7W5FLS5_9BACL|nr:glycosyl hydrolase 53 family protein [Paenibacillus phyllosphaerae]MBB3109540.1 arabinogalactan endo-1,4-beta-galactosidase [Paenibacillus phyllosphaerae]
MLPALKRWTAILLSFAVALTTIFGIISPRTAQAAETADEFIKGADISTLQALEDQGIKFYENGEEQDLLTILKDHGVNYIRLRVWNNPVEADGYNDKAKLIELAPRIKAAGMKLLVDFHYSDFWADPGKQVKPVAWEGLDFTQLKQAVYDYTEEVLTELEAVDAYPDMVQIGNEINNGMIHPEGSLSNFTQLADLIKQGVQAVRDTTPDGHNTKIMIHLAEGGNNSKFRSFFDEVTAQGIDYDVIGLSYYPYWHGTFQQLKSNMDDLAARYGKQIVVAETAYPFTYESGDAGEGNIAGENETKIAGFPASVENQKLVTETVLNTVAHVQNGLGLGAFYWEPAWLPGVGWRSGDYNGWENQAMFDYDGNALASLDAFQFTPGSLEAKTPILVYPSEGITITRGQTPELPATANVLYNEGSIQATAVTWDEATDEQLSTPGTFSLNGTIAGLEQKASIDVTVTDSPNLAVNPGFEDGMTGWTLSGTEAGKVETNAGNSHSGQNGFNYWYGSPYTYKLSQTITGLKNGVYTLSAWASGGGGENAMKLFADNYGGEAVQADIVNTGYNAWKKYTIENIHVTNGEITFGFDVDAPKEIWGWLDDVELVQVSEDELLKNGNFESGDLTGWTITGTSDAGKINDNPSNAQDGDYAFNYWYGTPYAFKLSQTVTGLKNGTYALKAWASGGGGESKLNLFAEGYGGEAIIAAAKNTGWNNWVQYTIPNIKVTDGQVTVGFDVAAPGEVWGYFDHIELVEVQGATAELTGASAVDGGDSFELTYGLDQLTLPFLTQELTLLYNPSYVEFVEASSTVEGLQVVQQAENEAGDAAYIVLATTGTPISDASSLLKLKFTAKPLASSNETSITVKNISYSDGEQTGTAVSAVHQLSITGTIDLSQLNAAITKAEQIYSTTKAGAFLGGYPVESRNALQTRIADAKTVKGNTNATQEEINAAVSALNAAVETYLSSAYTITTLAVAVNIKDLANVSKGFGKTNEATDWYLYRPFDTNADNKIDIVDLIATAKKIPGKFE